MNLKPLWQGSGVLYKLLDDYLGGSIDTALFCSNFEQAFNFDVDRHELRLNEAVAFEQLFNEVVFYSPFADERATIPNYRSEAQIRQAAAAADARLRAAG